MKNQKPKQVDETVSAFQKASPYLNIVYSLFGGIILFGYAGYALDDYFQKRPLFLIIGVFTGFFLGFYRMIKVIKDLER